jgi:subtilase family protein
MDHAIILIDPEKFESAAALILGAMPGIQALATSPLLIADPGDIGLGNVRAVDGVIDVATVDELQLGLLQGIDWAIQLNMGLLPELMVGGVAEAAAYPAIFEGPNGSVAPRALCAAANFSLTPHDDDVAPTLPGDPINHATRALAQFTVPVVAAGNHHTPGVPFETMSPWAEPDWVLAVGATSDEAGEVEWPHSGRGSVKRPGVGPDILAFGQDPFDENEWGTSFAAAGVTRMLVLTRAWLLQVLANIDRLAGGRFGVPLVGGVVIDRHFAANGLGPPSFDWPALPVIATSPGELERLTVEEVNRLGSALAWPVGHSASKAVLLAAAAATSPSPEVPLSAPSLTLARLGTFLDSLTGHRLLEIVDPSGSGPTRAGGAGPLFPKWTFDQLLSLVTSSQPAWSFDVDKRLGMTRQVNEREVPA